MPVYEREHNPVWSSVEDYLDEQLLSKDPILSAALAANRAAGLPAIDVSPSQGKFLHLLARIHHAKRILEIGTLGAYSSIWMARALPKDGRLISLEFEPKHAEVARANIERAGLSGVIEVRVGPALESLPILEKEGAGPFDLVFIDADKINNLPYFEWALRLTRVGSVIIVDNIVRDGKIVDSNSASDESVQGTHRLIEALSHETRVSATSVQTVGSKGYDGLILALVVA
ncbi:MAG TPA: O-methyltransferase [Bryobacteraceae bacterium]|jgi:predicted O-methyltransferase YrrM